MKGTQLVILDSTSCVPLESLEIPAAIDYALTFLFPLERERVGARVASEAGMPQSKIILPVASI